MRRAQAAALLLCLAASCVAGQAMYQAAGSGNPDPAPLLWQMMQLVMGRAKPAAVLSYRATSTNSGQQDFIGGISAFGSGDLPLTSAAASSLASANGAVQLPYMLETVSFFVNIPGLDKGQLYLSPCTLSKILNGAVVSWSGDDVVNDNPELANKTRLLGATAIQGVVYAGGSTLTQAVLAYLNKLCPSRPTTTTFPPFFTTVQNSAEMVAAISSTPYSLGYTVTYQGFAADLNEVLLNNTAGTVLSSTAATSDGPNSYLQNLAIALDGDWSSVSFAGLPGNMTWPIIVPNYFYLTKNLSSLGPSGGLVRAFLSFMLSDEAQTWVTSYGFVPLDTAVLSKFNASLYSLTTLNATTPNWWIASGSLTATGAAGGDFVINAAADTYLYHQMQAVSAAVVQNSAAVKYGNPYQVHAAGSFYTGPFMVSAMGTLMSDSRIPVYMTYRASGSISALTEFVNSGAAIASYQQMKISDMPLTQSDYSTLASNTQLGVLQIPILVGSISLYHNAPVKGYNVQLSACTVAKIARGNITKWNDPDILATNPQWAADASFANASITLLLYSDISMNVNQKTFVEWLSSACPEQWPLGSSFANTQDYGINTPQDMAQMIETMPYSLGFAPTLIGTDLNLYRGISEVLLRVPAGENQQAAWSTAGYSSRGGVALCYLARQALPKLSESWANVSLVAQPCAGAWPISYLTYAMIYANLTVFQESGPLTKAVIKYLLSPSGQQSAANMGHWSLPSMFIDRYKAQLVTDIILPAGLPEWTFEGSYGESGLMANGLYSFNSLRSNPVGMEIKLIWSQVAQMQQKIGNALPLVIRIIGPNTMSSLITQAVSDLENAASKPVDIAFDPLDIPSELLFANEIRANNPSYQIMITDSPMSYVKWSRLIELAQKQIVQVPLAAEAVMLVYNGLPGLKLPPCVLARLLKQGNVTWQDPDLVNANAPGFLRNAPNNLIRLRFPSSVSSFAPDGDSTPRVIPQGNLEALRRYVLDACPAEAQGLQSFEDLPQYDLATPPGVTATIPDVVTSLSGMAWSDIAVLNKASYTLDPLQEASIWNRVARQYVSLQLWNVTHLGMGWEEAWKNKAASGWPNSLNDDWSNFTLVGYAPGGFSYPIARADFVAIPGDLSPLGDAGGFMVSALHYWTSWWQNILDAAILPGVKSYARTSSDIVIAGIQQQLADNVVRLAPGQQPWPVVSTMAQMNENQTTTTGPSLVGVTYQPSLDFSSKTQDSAYLTLISQLQNAYNEQQKKIKEANDTAIAAVTLATIACAALAFLIVAVTCGWIGIVIYRKRLRSRSSNGNCFRPNEKHVELSVDSTLVPDTHGD